MDIFRNNNLLPVDIINRDPSLAGDTIAKMDVIRNSLELMEDRKNKNLLSKKLIMVY